MFAHNLLSECILYKNKSYPWRLDSHFLFHHREASNCREELPPYTKRSKCFYADVVIWWSHLRNGVGNNVPQCRVHGKIANFGTLGNNFGHLGPNLGMTPGDLRSQGIQQEQASPFHPGLHLNNWAKNFPPQDEVTYTTLKGYIEGIPHMIWQLIMTYDFVAK